MVSRQIVNRIRKYCALLGERGIPVSKGVVFGSYARGDQRAGSDIDLLVVSPMFDQGKAPRQVSTLWIVRRHADIRIEPIPVGAREYESDDVSPLIAAARREGIVIEMAPPARKSRARQNALAVAEPAGRYRTRKARTP